MAYAEKKKVPAVFTGRLSYEKMCSTLVHCDIAVNPIKTVIKSENINFLIFFIDFIYIPLNSMCLHYTTYVRKFQVLYCFSIK